jgi:hypothetical protein
MQQTQRPLVSHEERQHTLRPRFLPHLERRRWNDWWIFCVCSLVAFIISKKLIGHLEIRSEANHGWIEVPQRPCRISGRPTPRGTPLGILTE